MSGILEQLLAAVTRNNELLEGAAEGREKVLAAAEAASTKATKPAATKAATAKAEEKPAVTKTEEADVPSVDDVNVVIKKYVGGSERKDERSARSAKVKGVLTKNSPTDTESPTAGTLFAEKRGVFIKTVEKWIKDGDLTQPEPAASDDDDLLED